MNHRLIKVGRSQENDIVISDASVSKFHLELFFDGEGNAFLTDKNSTNGTFVNGLKINGSVQLSEFDIVKAGNSEPIKWKEFIMSKPAIIEQENFKKDFNNDLVSKKKSPIKTIIVTIGVSLSILILFFILNEYVFDSKPEIIDPNKPNDSESQQPEKLDKKENKTIEYDYSCLKDEKDMGSTKITEIFGNIESESMKTFGGEVSMQDEYEVGDDLLKDCRNKYDFIEKGDKYKNLETILRRLAKELKNPVGYRYSIYLIKSEELNAFTAGAKIFVTTTMYDFCKSNDELACIIGHEINHNELGHIKEQLQKEQILGKEGAALNTMLTISFGQKKELACDLHGIDLVIAAGYNGCVNINLWKRMKTESNEGAFDPLDNLFRSHPYSDKRGSCSANHIKNNYGFDCVTK